MTPTGRILLPFFIAWCASIFIAVFTVTVVLKVVARGLDWVSGEQL